MLVHSAIIQGYGDSELIAAATPELLSDLRGIGLCPDRSKLAVGVASACKLAVGLADQHCEVYDVVEPLLPHLYP